MIDFNSLSDAELISEKVAQQQIAGARYSYTMGKLAMARSNVRKINTILRERGLIADPKKPARDASGFVAQAVAPLKIDAQEHARERAIDNYWRLFRLIEASGWDLDVIAPRPSSTKDSKIQYRQKQARRELFWSLFTRDADASLAAAKERGIGYNPGAVVIMKADDERKDKYIAEEVEAVGLAFDAYVIKLEGKVGEGVTGATVTGRLWQGSCLTVWKGEAIERWHTQQILNVSVLGKLFNQWPTRRMK